MLPQVHEGLKPVSFLRLGVKHVKGLAEAAAHPSLTGDNAG
jgi:hypothetical protein